MDELHFLFKILTLALLNRSELPLRGNEIAEFFGENRYTDYFTSQQIIGSLLEGGLITDDNAGRGYTLTDEGKTNVNLFQDRVSETHKADIDAFLSEKKIAIQTDRDIVATYDRAEGGGYLSHLIVRESVRDNPREKKKIILELKINVATKEQAENLCLNFRAHYDDVYANLIENLS